MGHENTHTPLTLLVTYAPNRGYKTTTKSNNGDKFNKHSKKYQNTTWQYGGQVQTGNLGEMKQNQNNTTKYLAHTQYKTPENGNGVKLAQRCIRRKMIPMGKWERAKLTKTKKKSTRANAPNTQNKK